MKRSILFFPLLLTTIIVCGQSLQNWHWKDYTTDSVHGISLHKAYKIIATLPQKPSPIIIAVIDGGIDTNHQVLKNLLWKNLKEIPNNKIDDDQNGYIDDYNGWNFLGGKDGRNINKASDEKSRIYHRFKKQYDNQNIDTLTLTQVEKNNYLIWKQTESEIQFSDNDLANLEYIKMAAVALKKMGTILLKELPDSNFTAPQLQLFQPIGRVTLETKMAYLRTLKVLGVDEESTYPEIINDLTEYIEGKEKAAISKEISPLPIREDIIKDVYYNFNDKFYGNNDITGPNARHGTHVAGLVASIPDSNWHVNNLYPDIKIMGIRTIPDGDEYDKDVALAIRYAVDNGATIINMSFGKSYSPEQAWVDSAIRYAEKKDVLMIHAAGNEYYDLNTKLVYPSPFAPSFKNAAKNIITVAASSDPSFSESLLTDFSNYGPKVVDLISPGDKIYSTLPGIHNYGFMKGTSMASPIVSHIAALIRSYFPKLTAIEVKEILLRSAWTPSDTAALYLIPQREQSKSLKEISAGGGIVNAASAIDMAKKYMSEKLTIKNKKVGTPKN